MRVLVVCATITGALAVATGALQAQVRSPGRDTVDVSAGARIRVSALTLTNPSLIGRVEAVHGDSLWIRYAPTSPALGLSRVALTNLEVSRGTPGVRRHILIGAALGAAAGALFGYMAASDADCVDCPASARHSAKPGAALFFGTLGGLGGLLWGSTLGDEVWQPGRLPLRDAR
jgi:ABC-type Fe3+-siderophore transport system permease subunit